MCNIETVLNEFSGLEKKYHVSPFLITSVLNDMDLEGSTDFSISCTLFAAAISIINGIYDTVNFDVTDIVKETLTDLRNANVECDRENLLRAVLMDDYGTFLVCAAKKSCPDIEEVVKILEEWERSDEYSDFRYR